MSYSGGTAPYAAPTSQMPTPRRPGRKGPPLWLGVLLLLVAPAFYFIGVVTWIFPTVELAALEGTRTVADGESFAVRADSDYIVLAPAHTSCTVKMTGTPRAPLDEGLREANDWPVNGQIYWEQGYFDVPRDGRATVRCAGSPPMAVSRWQGDLPRVIAIGRYGGYAAWATSLVGLVMIVFRRKHPVW